VYDTAESPCNDNPGQGFQHSFKAVRSTNGGVNWGSPFSVADDRYSTCMTVTASGGGLDKDKSIRAPAIPAGAVDPISGTMHVVWQDASRQCLSITCTVTNDIVMATSTNGGSTWGTPARISSNTSRNHFTPAITANHFNTSRLLVVSYYQRDPNYTNQLLLSYSTSTNGGSTWSSEHLVTNGTATSADNPKDLPIQLTCAAQTDYGRMLGDYMGLLLTVGSTAQDARTHIAWTAAYNPSGDHTGACSSGTLNQVATSVIVQPSP
jgi:Neuraminidase (sialidase)